MDLLPRWWPGWLDGPLVFMAVVLVGLVVLVLCTRRWDRPDREQADRRRRER